LEIGTPQAIPNLQSLISKMDKPLATLRTRPACSCRRLARRRWWASGLAPLQRAHPLVYQDQVPQQLVDRFLGSESFLPPAVQQFLQCLVVHSVLLLVVRGPMVGGPWQRSTTDHRRRATGLVDARSAAHQREQRPRRVWAYTLRPGEGAAAAAHCATIRGSLDACANRLGVSGSACCLVDELLPIVHPLRRKSK